MNLKEDIIYDFSIIGGDKRQVYLAEILAKKKNRVTTYATASNEIPNGCEDSESFLQAILQAKNIILPIPMLSSDGDIHNKKGNKNLKFQVLKDNINQNQRLFAGCIPNQFIDFMEDNKIKYIDFMKDDTIAIFNSIATAEGIIAEAIMKNPINLHNSTTLILGYGKCGRTLADKLKLLSAKTTVSVRNPSQIILAEANGHNTLILDKLPSRIGEFKFIFNTIPEVILDKRLLNSVASDSMIFDIASLPGGVDYKAAKEIGVEAEIYLGLPGKYAPKSSAIALANFIISNQNT